MEFEGKLKSHLTSMIKSALHYPPSAIEDRASTAPLRCNASRHFAANIAADPLFSFICKFDGNCKISLSLLLNWKMAMEFGSLEFEGKKLKSHLTSMIKSAPIYTIQFGSDVIL